MTELANHDRKYEADLAAEAAMWGRAASDLAQQLPPDWRHHRVKLRHNILYQAAQVDAFLSHVRPGMQVLEAGCGSGWLTLAMAQRGAQATGMDISEQALTVGRNYYESIREEVDGSVTYKVADLNALELEPHSLDVIAVCGALHHLPQAQHTISEFYKALKPGGLLWVSDLTEEEPLPNVLFSAFFMFLLPIDPGYREKITKLIHFGPRALSRVKASLEAEGLSPFEGAGRGKGWLEAIEEHFDVLERGVSPSSTKHLTDVRLPDRSALIVLRVMSAVERFLLRLGLLGETAIVVYARKS